jgi:hypothetical protein
MEYILDQSNFAATDAVSKHIFSVFDFITNHPFVQEQYKP